MKVKGHHAPPVRLTPLGAALLAAAAAIPGGLLLMLADWIWRAL